MSTQSPAAELVEVRKTYGPGGTGTEVLRGVSFAIRRGESVAVVGPSGSGKSTLLNIIGTLDRPTSGSVRLEGRELAGLDDGELARLRNRKIGFVFQFHHLLPQCTLLENVLVPTLVLRGQAAGAADRARRLLDRVGLSHRLGHHPGQLSGGECQRAAVVRALINQPGLVLADEPTGSLDHSGSEKLADLMVELNREEGVTLIVVTHSAALAGRMGRVLAIEDGRLKGQA
jgi:lipoprotein-releasing system ATP-binding protein